MGIFQILIFAVLLIAAVTLGNIISYKWVQAQEDKKAEKDMLSMILQQNFNPSTTAA